MDGFVFEDLTCINSAGYLVWSGALVRYEQANGRIICMDDHHKCDGGRCAIARVLASTDGYLYTKDDGADPLPFSAFGAQPAVGIITVCMLVLPFEREGGVLLTKK